MWLQIIMALMQHQMQASQQQQQSLAASNGVASERGQGLLQNAVGQATEGDYSPNGNAPTAQPANSGGVLNSIFQAVMERYMQNKAAASQFQSSLPAPSSLGTPPISSTPSTP